ncbi:MAG: outer membrane lipoprotein carrier protein LolA [Acidobacteriota bacterium]
MRTNKVRLLSLLLLTALLLPGVALGNDNPWTALESLRGGLRAQSPLQADFVQTYTPAGFTEGETEQGRVALSLPHCLRWDYAEPFPKSFLLCGDTAWFWNPGEPKGHRYPVRNQEAPGFDFFLMDTDELQVRYNATARRTARGLEVELLPTQPTEEVARAHVVIDTKAGRVLSLGYEDAEGSKTLFEITDYRQGAEVGQFAAPADVEWEDP